MRARALAPTVRAVVIDRRRWRLATPGPIVPDIDPEPPGLGLAAARIEHRHRGVVGMELGRAHDVAAQGLDQRLEQPCGAADPVGQGGAVELDPFSRVDLSLAIQRQVVAVLRHEHVGQQPRAGPPALDRQRRQRRLGDALAGPAGELWPDVPDHLEARWHVFEHLGHVLAERAQIAAALRAGAGGGVHHLLARQMFGQRPARRLARCPGAGGADHLQPGGGRLLGGRAPRLGRLEVLELQLELGDLPAQPLRRLAELLAPQPRECSLRRAISSRLALSVASCPSTVAVRSRTSCCRSATSSGSLARLICTTAD